MEVKDHEVQADDRDDDCNGHAAHDDTGPGGGSPCRGFSDVPLIPSDYR